jgi:hypothetical protein
MDEQTTLTRVTLSQEELLYLLDLLQAPPLPGMAIDETGRSLMLTAAERALRARELAVLRPGGELAVHNDLLNLVGTCAYPQRRLFADHWDAAAEQPERYFACSREDTLVAHTAPEAFLHRFTLLPDDAALAEQVLSHCRLQNVPAGAAYAFSLQADDFVQFRQLNEAGSAGEALDLLKAQQISEDAAQAFVNTLSALTGVSILQIAVAGQDESVSQRDFTVLQGNEFTWLLLAAQDNPQQLEIKTLDGSALGSLMVQWFEG